MKKTIKLKIDGSEVIVEAERAGNTLTIDRGDETYTVELVRDESSGPAPVRAATVSASVSSTPAPSSAPTPAPSTPSASAGVAGPGAIPAPMTGTVKSMLVAVGDTVAAGDQIVMMEAMKMDIEVAAPNAGSVTEIYVNTGETVKEGQPLLSIA